LYDFYSRFENKKADYKLIILRSTSNHKNVLQITQVKCNNVVIIQISNIVNKNGILNFLRIKVRVNS